MDSISKQFITKILDDPECEVRLDAGDYAYVYGALQHFLNSGGTVKALSRKVISDFTRFLLESDINPLEGQEIIRPYMFCGDLTAVSLPEIPSSIKEIRVGAYKNVTSSDTVIIVPGTVYSVSAAAFDTLDNIESIIFEDGVEYIAVGAIKDCKNLKTVEIPNSVKELRHFISADYAIRKNISIKFNGTTDEFYEKLTMPLDEFRNNSYFSSFKEVLNKNNEIMFN